MREPDDLSARVAHHFATAWRDYDRQIRRIIPHYDGALDVLVGVLKRSYPASEWIVDVGMGTGGLAGDCSRRSPQPDSPGSTSCRPTWTSPRNGWSNTLTAWS